MAESLTTRQSSSKEMGMDHEVAQGSNNAATQRRLVEEAQAQGRLAAVDEILTPDFVDHTPFPGMPPTREGVKQIFAMIRAGLPDHDARIEQMVAQGDLVATYKSFTGTHDGELFGVAPTGRRVTIRVMDFVRYRDGQLAEHWNIVDVAGLMAQLGVDDAQGA
jgi:predicted ester cyclase